MNANNKISKTKDSYWQGIRGICIIAVILIHSKNGIGYENNFVASWNFDYWLVMRQFINFPVTIFIFLSDYFTNIESAKKFNIPHLTNRGRGGDSYYYFWYGQHFIYQLM